MKWLGAFLFPLLVGGLALACEDEEEEASLASVSPAAAATATSEPAPSLEPTTVGPGRMGVTEYRDWAIDVTGQMGGVVLSSAELMQDWIEADVGSPEQRIAAAEFQRLASQTRELHQEATRLRPPEGWDQYHGALTDATDLSASGLEVIAEGFDDNDLRKVEEGVSLMEAGGEAVDNLPPIPGR